MKAATGRSVRRLLPILILASSKWLEASGPAFAVDVSVGADNRTLTLFADANQLTVFRSYDDKGNSTAIGPNGPYAGWGVRAVAEGRDDLARVLWTNVDGSAALWFVGPTGNQASHLYAASTGWTAIDVSVASDSTTHVLWTNVDGRTKIASVADSGAVLEESTHGPFSGWIARSIADGDDGLTRLLWNNVDGRVGLSLIDAGQITATFRFTPEAGWTARDVAVAAYNRARILLTDAANQMALWSVDNSGAVSDSGSVYRANQTGLTPRRVTTGADGLTRVLWTSSIDNYGAVWILSYNNVYQSSFFFCPDFGATLSCGYWDY
jgi:hypothetical protein